MAAGKILNDEDLEVMTRQLNIISRAIEGYYNNTTTVINSFNNEAIVQSFYSSGKFGQEKQNQLKNITEAVKKYWDKSMCDEHALFLTPYDTIWNGFGQF